MAGDFAGAATRQNRDQRLALWQVMSLKEFSFCR
jgi:hypothetical protein